MLVDEERLARVRPRNGGRHFRADAVDQNLDSYSVEYTYPDGSKLFYNGCNITGCLAEFASYAARNQGRAIISTNAHAPGRVRTFKGQNFAGSDLIWAFPQPEPSPYQMEWADPVDAIRDDTPYNEAKRGAEGQSRYLHGTHGRTYRPGNHLRTESPSATTNSTADDTLTMDSPAPSAGTRRWKYPVPQPGITKLASSDSASPARRAGKASRQRQLPGNSPATSRRTPATAAG